MPDRDPYRLELTAEEADLVTEALDARSDQLQRAATKAAGELEAEVQAGEVSDPRSSAVKIVRTLGEAAILTRAAAQLRDGPDEQLRQGEAEAFAQLADAHAQADAADDEVDEETLAAAREELGIESSLDEDEPADALAAAEG